MTDFADVEQFSREHSACGALTPTAAPQPGGGFLLTLTCACGATFDRWVTAEEAKQPLPLPRRAVAAGARPAPSAPEPARVPERPRGPEPPPDLAAALREALAAEDEAPLRAAPSEDAVQAVMREAMAAEGKPAAPPAPVGPRPPAPARVTSPAKLNLDTTIRTALDQQSALKGKAPAAAGPPRTRVVALVLFAVLALGIGGAIFLAGESETPEPAPTVSTPAAAPPLPLDQQQRAALDEIMKALRQLQAASSTTTSLPVYSSRVIFAKTDVDRFIDSTAPGPDRAAVREVIGIHVLAEAAWKARALDQKERWETVGQDAAIDLCPSVKRVVDFATPSEGVSRGQARGAAVAGAIPLLWECAAAKIDAIDRAPAAE